MAHTHDCLTQRVSVPLLMRPLCTCGVLLGFGERLPLIQSGRHIPIHVACTISSTTCAPCIVSDPVWRC